MRFCLAALSCGLGVLFMAGCQNDEIQSYEVRRIQPQKRETRMLAAILPHGERTWYFKLTGPPEQVAQYKDAFRQFVESSRFNDSPNQPLTWEKIPDGWKREPGEKMRYATFRLGSGGEPLELLVTPLGRESGSVVSNINRWRGELGLASVSDADLPKLIEETKAGAETVKLVDMTGQSSGVARMPPFVGGDKQAPVARAIQSLPFTYTKPGGWTETTARMSVASFAIDSKDGSALVTVIPLPGDAGGLLANVNRWRSQLQLGPIGTDSLGKDAPPIDVAGTTGHYVDILGAESPAAKRERMLAVAFQHEANTWFIKMRGSPELVALEKPNFEAFVKSIQFEPANRSR
jgi:hypothetical protein